MNYTSRMITGGLVALAIACRHGGCLGLAKPSGSPQHVRTRRDCRQPGRRQGFHNALPGRPGPTSQQAPVYPAVLALAYAVAGVESPKALLLLELGQSILGGVLVLGVINLALSIAPGHQRLAWTSGLVSAFHPTLIYAATHVQVASLGTALFIWTLAMAYRTGASKCVGHAVITGLHFLPRSRSPTRF